MLFAVLVLLFVGAVGCRSPQAQVELRRFDFSSPQMGTLFTISLFAPNEQVGRTAADAAFRRVAALEEIMSDYQADSELMQLCDQPWGRPVPVSQDLFRIFEQAEFFSRKSGGAFDVTIGPCVRLWRFARKRHTLPAPAEIRDAKARVGFQNLRLDARAQTATLLVPGMRLDLGGIAKGYAADEALKLLKGMGISRALVAASGDIAIGEPPPGETGWRVALSAIDAKDSGKTTQTIRLRNAGISTSGDTEQFIEIEGVRYSHIIDPATCLGLTRRIQATVIAPNAITTDAMATAVCILGPERGLKTIDSIPGAAAVVTIKDASGEETLRSRRFASVAGLR